MSGRIDPWWPYLGGMIAAAGVAWMGHHGWRGPVDPGGLFSAVTNMSVIAIGFLFAAQTILLTIDAARVGIQANEAAQHRGLVNAILHAITLSFVLAGLSVAGMMFDGKANGPLTTPCFATWAGLLVAAALAYYQVIWHFTRVARGNWTR